MTERKARAAARAKGKQGQEQSKGRSGSLLAWSVGPLVLQGWKQVFPCGILFFDEFDFLGARVALEDFFAGYRAADVTEVFEVNQAVDLVTGCMGAGGAFAVGDGSAGKVAGHTCVEVSRAAGKDVDPEVELSALHGREDSRGGGEKQIPCGDDRKKSNGNGKSKGNGNGNDRSRSPAGMTERKARACGFGGWCSPLIAPRAAR